MTAATQVNRAEAYWVEVLSSDTWDPPTPASPTQFIYDGDGGRVKQTTANSTTVFLGDVYEKIIAGDSAGDKTLHLFAGSQRIASYRPATAAPASTIWYHGDHLGSSNVITDENGALAELTEHTPFGGIHRNEGSLRVAHKFTGQRLDSSTGLYYYHARYYDPQLGRFIQPDAIVQSAVDPQFLNRYSYARNNPLKYIDPTGHFSWKKFWHSFAGAFVGAVVTVLTAGAGAPLMLAGAIGGAAGGAVTGGLEGGWKGAAIGAATGGALGAVGGWGVGQFGVPFAVGMLAVRTGVAAATNSWDSFAGGLTGGYLGAAVGTGINSYYRDPLRVATPDGRVRNEVVEGRGILTTPEKALRVANETGSKVLYTRSRGFLPDLVRGGMQMAFKNSLASRQMAAFMLSNSNTNYSFHSEATLTALGAARMLGASGKQVGGGVNLVSAFYPQSTAERAFGGIGMSVHWTPPHIADSAGMFTTFNPVAAVTYGATGVVTLEHFHGYETYYPNQ